MKDENIDKDKPCNIYGVSCRSRYKQTSKLINGYSQMNSTSRALGFKEPYDGTCAIVNYRHIINFSDVETVVKWLFEEGYDVVKLREKNGN